MYFSYSPAQPRSSIVSLLAAFAIASTYIRTVEAGSVGGTYSTTLTTTVTTSSPNTLALAVPFVFVAFLLLCLTICCCSYRRAKPRKRRYQQLSTLRGQAELQERRRVAQGLGLGIMTPIPPVDPEWVVVDPGHTIAQEHPPPYTPQSIHSLSAYSPAPSASPSACGSPRAQAWTSSPFNPDEEIQRLLNVPSPFVTRDGSLSPHDRQRALTPPPQAHTPDVSHRSRGRAFSANGSA